MLTSTRTTQKQTQHAFSGPARITSEQHTLTSRVAGPPSPHATLLHLQRIAGNQAVTHLLQMAQQTSSPGVPGEQSASVQHSLAPDKGNTHAIPLPGAFPLQQKRSTKDPSVEGISQKAVPLQRETESIQKKENKTGLPDILKVGVENLSGLSMDDVHVHCNSSKPAQMQALAYTQGTDIHVGPGQEKHLAHEAWHVVQQKQGRVKPTLQAKGVAMNDNQMLEQEASTMGLKAFGGGPPGFVDAKSRAMLQSNLHVVFASKDGTVIQRMTLNNLNKWSGNWEEDSVKYWVVESEEAGVGHVAARHIDISMPDMIKRLQVGETQKDPATRFHDDGFQTIAEALNAFSGEIDDWANNEITGGKTILHEVDELKVDVYDQAGKTGKGAFDAYIGPAVVVVIMNRKNPAVAGAPVQFYLVTAFPKIVRGTTEKKKSGKGKKKHLKKEQTRMEKAQEKEMEKKLKGK
jgi:hypothetical protein